MSDELKPCAHCGASEPESGFSEYQGDAHSPHSWVDCRGCPAGTLAYSPNESAAKAAWNRRAQPERNQAVDDLPMLVKRLAQALRKAAPDHALPNQAMDYLQRNGLQGSPLREDQPERKLTDAEICDLLPAIPEGDRFADESKFRYLGTGSGVNLYEVWGDAVQSYALKAVKAVLAAQPAAATVPDGPDLTKTNIPAGDVWGGTLDQLYAAFHREPCGDTLAAIGCAIQDLQAMQTAAQWISVADRLPEDRQAVAFVVDCKASAWEYLNGRVLGGTFVANQGFGIPGLTIGASYWMPLPQPPAAQPQDDGENMHTQSTHQENVSKNEPVSYACDRTGMMMPSRCGDCGCWSNK